MNIVKLTILAVLIAALSGCVMVQNEEWDKLQKDINDIKRDSADVKKAKEVLGLQTDEMKKTINILKSQIQDIEKSTGAQASSSEKDIRKKQADIVADLTAVRSDFQVLTGRFEETRYAIQKSVQEGKNSRSEIEVKLKETAQILEELQKRIASLEQVTALLRQEREQGKEQGTGKVPEAVGFEDAYKDAYETLQKGDYKAAREKFQKYLETHPGSKYAENALYWIGDSYYSEKNYEKAIVVYDDVVKKYPDGAKAPAAILKQGMAFSALGDRKSANAIFKKLVERYPKSEQADTAKKKLKE